MSPSIAFGGQPKGAQSPAQPGTKPGSLSCAPVRRLLLALLLLMTALGAGSCESPASPSTNCQENCQAARTFCYTLGSSWSRAAWNAYCDGEYDECVASCR